MITIAPTSQIKLFIAYLLHGDHVTGQVTVTGSPGRQSVSVGRR
jgi:hypothetical protein